MDIQQFSTMVRDLILSQDEVVLPGLGTFIAGIEPASFSDRGYTVNPPYRKLSFHPDSSGVSEDEETRLCIEEIKSALASNRVVELPLLGKLRLTTSGEMFFVADPELDIYPDAFGLHPVSMKNHDPQPYDIELPELSEDDAVSAADLPDSDIEEPMIEPAQEQITDTAPEPQTKETMQQEQSKKKSALRIFGIILFVIAVAMIAFRLLAMIAPDFIDSILYSEEELRMLGK